MNVYSNPTPTLSNQIQQLLSQTLGTTARPENYSALRFIMLVWVQYCQYEIIVKKAQLKGGWPTVKGNSI